MKNSIIKIIGAVAVINLVSRFLGFIREVIIGYHFGTSYLADSVITAYTIPNFIYIVAGGAITTAFISVYSKSENSIIQSQIREVLFTYTVIIFSIISIVFMVFPTWWTNLFFSGLSTEELKTTANLFQIMAPSTLFLVLSMFLSGILNVNERFRLTAFAPLVNNFLYVLIALLFFPILHERAYGWGALFASIAMIFMLIRGIRNMGVSTLKLRFTMEDKGYIVRFLKISIPILLGGATLQFYFLIHRIFASSLESGFISALNYASKLVQLPQSILMAAVTTVIYPLIAKRIKEREYGELGKMYSSGLQYLFFLMVPSTIFLYFYAEEVIRIVFENGSFDHQSTLMTSNLLKITVIGMFAHAANLYVTRFYYAMEKAFLPVASGVIAVFGVNILIIVLFIDQFGAAAIAWATTISAYIQLAILLFYARLKLKLFINANMNILKQIILGFFITILIMALIKWLPVKSDIMTVIIGLVAIGVSVVIGSYILKIKELEALLSMGRKRKG